MNHPIPIFWNIFLKALVIPQKSIDSQNCTTGMRKVLFLICIVLRHPITRKHFFLIKIKRINFSLNWQTYLTASRKKAFFAISLYIIFSFDYWFLAKKTLKFVNYKIHLILFFLQPSARLKRGFCNEKDVKVINAKKFTSFLFIIPFHVSVSDPLSYC